MPLGEVGAAEQLGTPLQLGGQGLRELPHPHRIARPEMRGDMRYVRTHPQPLAVPVDQHEAQPVGALGGGQRGDDRPQQLRTAAAGRPLDQQVRPLGGEVGDDGSAWSGAQYGGDASAERLGVVGRVRPARHQRGRGGAGQAQLVQQPRGLGQRCGHARVPPARGAVRAQRSERPGEPLGPCPGDRVDGGEGAVADRARGRPGAGRGHPEQPQGGRHVTAEQGDGPALPERRRHRAGRLVGLRHRRRG